MYSWLHSCEMKPKISTATFPAFHFFTWQKLLQLMPCPFSDLQLGVFFQSAIQWVTSMDSALIFSKMLQLIDETICAILNMYFETHIFLLFLHIWRPPAATLRLVPRVATKKDTTELRCRVKSHRIWPPNTHRCQMKTNMAIAGRFPQIVHRRYTYIYIYSGLIPWVDWTQLFIVHFPKIS